MFEVFPSEGDIGGFGIFLHQVQDSDSQVTLVNQMSS